MEKARSVLPWGWQGRGWLCCQHPGLTGTQWWWLPPLLGVSPARGTGCGHLCRLPSTSPSCLQCHQGSVPPVTGSVTATGTEVPSPLPGQALMDPGLPRMAEHQVHLSPSCWGYWWDWVPLALYLPVGLCPPCPAPVAPQGLGLHCGCQQGFASGFSTAELAAPGRHSRLYLCPLHSWLGAG